jgi:hypothetical protein
MNLSTLYSNESQCTHQSLRGLLSKSVKILLFNGHTNPTPTTNPRAPSLPAQHSTRPARPPERHQGPYSSDEQSPPPCHLSRYERPKTPPILRLWITSTPPTNGDNLRTPSNACNPALHFPEPMSVKTGRVQDPTSSNLCVRIVRQ